MSTGSFIDLGIGSYSGKNQGELSLHRQLIGIFLPQDVMLADRLMCLWREINRELALHYSLQRMEGVQLRQVLLPKGERGGWRENYSKDNKIDPSGTMPTGEKFQGITDFRSLLIARHEQFTRALTEKLMAYALGRASELADRAVIDDLMKNLSSNKGGFKDLVLAVVLS